uniref:Uncharacterized protein n=1 Tax=Chromera velia CCMP2878 TaxID=1169474 RepID=A0A0G4HNW0_9ALVE|eukprot:Cvel_7701.t1-p1 / transcript=Cvel_7701.t1 / gene=Cvel_7701 / organism=Chromera_velia_CCMP2878 / gene_product=hypothetical protein / transcript_product=hypothetical protein / location=Cvel_scaffold409:14372-26400(-) / protein_length=1432 / sequence_SO=supercontig / SO=protein_coding / is_pseudo=false
MMSLRTGILVLLCGTLCSAYETRLQDIVLSAGSLSPPFEPNITSYSVVLPEAPREVTCVVSVFRELYAHDRLPTIEMGGRRYAASSIVVGHLLLDPDGTKTASIEVKNPSDVRENRTYTISFTSEQVNLCSLHSLGIKDSRGASLSHKLFPRLSEDKDAYYFSIPPSVKFVTYTPKCFSGATVKINHESGLGKIGPGGGFKQEQSANFYTTTAFSCVREDRQKTIFVSFATYRKKISPPSLVLPSTGRECTLRNNSTLFECPIETGERDLELSAFSDSRTRVTLFNERVSVRLSNNGGPERIPLSLHTGPFQLRIDTGPFTFLVFNTNIGEPPPEEMASDSPLPPLPLSSLMRRHGGPSPLSPVGGSGDSTGGSLLGAQMPFGSGTKMESAAVTLFGVVSGLFFLPKIAFGFGSGWAAGGLLQIPSTALWTVQGGAAIQKSLRGSSGDGTSSAFFFSLLDSTLLLWTPFWMDGGHGRGSGGGGRRLLHGGAGGGEWLRAERERATGALMLCGAFLLLCLCLHLVALFSYWVKSASDGSGDSGCWWQWCSCTDGDQEGQRGKQQSSSPRWPLRIPHRARMGTWELRLFCHLAIPASYAAGVLFLAPGVSVGLRLVAGVILLSEVLVVSVCALRVMALIRKRFVFPLAGAVDAETAAEEREGGQAAGGRGYARVSVEGGLGEVRQADLTDLPVVWVDRFCDELHTGFRNVQSVCCGEKRGPIWAEARRAVGRIRFVDLLEGERESREDLASLFDPVLSDMREVTVVSGCKRGKRGEGSGPLGLRQGVQGRSGSLFPVGVLKTSSLDLIVGPCGLETLYEQLGGTTWVSRKGPPPGAKAAYGETIADAEVVSQFTDCSSVDLDVDGVGEGQVRRGMDAVREEAVAFVKLETDARFLQGPLTGGAFSLFFDGSRHPLGRCLWWGLAIVLGGCAGASGVVRALSSGSGGMETAACVLMGTAGCLLLLGGGLFLVTRPLKGPLENFASSCALLCTSVLCFLSAVAPGGGSMVASLYFGIWALFAVCLCGLSAVVLCVTWRLVLGLCFGCVDEETAPLGECGLGQEVVGPGKRCVHVFFAAGEQDRRRPLEVSADRRQTVVDSAGVPLGPGRGWRAGAVRETDGVRGVAEVEAGVACEALTDAKIMEIQIEPRVEWSPSGPLVSLQIFRDLEEDPEEPPSLQFHIRDLREALQSFVPVATLTQQHQQRGASATSSVGVVGRPHLPLPLGSVFIPSETSGVDATRERKGGAQQSWRHMNLYRLDDASAPLFAFLSRGRQIRPCARELQQAIEKEVRAAVHSGQAGGSRQATVLVISVAPPSSPLQRAQGPPATVPGPLQSSTWGYVPRPVPPQTVQVDLGGQYVSPWVHQFRRQQAALTKETLSDSEGEDEESSASETEMPPYAPRRQWTGAAAVFPSSGPGMMPYIRPGAGSGFRYPGS